MREQSFFAHAGMLRKVPLIILASLTIIAACNCASSQRAYHAYVMRGTIIEKTSDNLYICIGSKDKASVGQELDVIVVRSQSAGNPKAPITFTRNKVGRIRITEIIDEHFAKATLISGEADKHSIVEIE